LPLGFPEDLASLVPLWVVFVAQAVGPGHDAANCDPLIDPGSKQRDLGAHMDGGGFLVLMLVGGIVCGIVAGIIASGKNRSGGGFFFLGLFLGLGSGVPDGFA
jgi:hypothetical protein